jgi:hypothetical protein
MDEAYVKVGCAGSPCIGCDKNRPDRRIPFELNRDVNAPKAFLCGAMKKTGPATKITLEAMRHRIGEAGNE